MHTYQLPTIPLSPVDLVNRRAAATGSVRYAQLTSYADYNGHHVTVSFKPYAVSGAKWNAEYHWGGRVVIGRGSLEACLRAAKAEHDRGAHGCCVVVNASDAAPESEAEQIKLFKQYDFEPAMEKNQHPPYWTGTHQAVSDALSWESYGGGGHFAGMVSHALQYKGSIDDWAAERDRWLASRHQKRA